MVHTNLRDWLDTINFESGATLEEWEVIGSPNEDCQQHNGVENVVLLLSLGGEPRRETPKPKTQAQS